MKALASTAGSRQTRRIAIVSTGTDVNRGVFASKTRRDDAAVSTR
jgi:hypothetical protein